MNHEDDSFEQEFSQGRTSLVGEFWYFLKENKKWWLIPIIVALGFLGALVILGGSGAAPFIYTLF